MSGPWEFVGHDGIARVTLGHGYRCVVVQVRESPGRRAFVILDANEARRLAAALVEQAGFSEVDPLTGLPTRCER